MNAVRTSMRAVRESWRLVVTALVVGLAGSAVYVLGQTRLHESTVQFYVTAPSASESVNGPFQADSAALRRINSYLVLVKSDVLSKKIAKSYDLGLSAGKIRSELSASTVSNTVTIEVQVKDTSAGRSLKLADAVAETLPTVLQTVEGIPVNRPTALVLQVISPPRLHSGTVGTARAVTLALGGLIGLIVGIALALLRALFRGTVMEPDELAQVTGVATLAVIPRAKRTAKNPFADSGVVGSGRAEAVRSLRTALGPFAAAESGTTIVITSATPGEGRTTTAANLALAFGELSKRVLLIEADLRRPALARYLQLEPDQGLSNILSGTHKLGTQVQSWAEHNVDVLTAGPAVADPSALLARTELKDLLTQASAEYDVVLLDSPALSRVSDAAAVAAICNATVLLVRRGRTRFGSVTAARQALQQVNATVVGSVLNFGRSANR